MRKRMRILFPVLIVSGLTVLWFLGPREVLGYPTGAPSGYSSSPADARTCATPGCHSGPPQARQGWIQSDIPPDGFLPGQTYTLSFTVTRPGVTKYGFQASPVDSFNKQAGTFSLAEPITTQLGTGAYYVTHTSAGNSGNGGRTWTAYWTAPSTWPLWPVTIYTAFVAGDSLGNDSVYHSKLRLFPKNMGITEQAALPCLSIHQASGRAILYTNIPMAAIVEAFDMRGRLLWMRGLENGEQNVTVPQGIDGIVLFRASWRDGQCSIRTLI